MKSLGATKIFLQKNEHTAFKNLKRYNECCSINTRGKILWKAKISWTRYGQLTWVRLYVLLKQKLREHGKKPVELMYMWFNYVLLYTLFHLKRVLASKNGFGTYYILLNKIQVIHRQGISYRQKILKTGFFNFTDRTFHR